MEIFAEPNLKLFIMIAWLPVLLLALEIVLFFLGMSSSFESEADLPDMGEGGFDVEPAAEDFALLNEQDIAALDIPMDDRREFLRPKPKGVRKILHFAGFGSTPVTVTIALASAMVAGLGFSLQLAANMLTGETLSAGLALAIVLIPGLWVGGVLSHWVGRHIPSLETTAINASAYNGRRGVVVYGPAKRGEPVPVRWTDSYGTTHTTQAEPLRDDDVIEEDAPVLLLRTRERQARIIAIQ